MLASEQNLEHLQVTINRLASMISNRIVEKINKNMELDGHFGTCTLFKEHEAYDADTWNNVMYSTYQKDVISAAESKLYAQGYNCDVKVEKHSIHYATRIVPSTNYKKLCMSAFVVFMVGLGTVYMGGSKSNPRSTIISSKYK